MTDGFESAARLLPGAMREAAWALPERDRLRAEEFRLRAGREPGVLLPEGEKTLCRGRRVRQGELLGVLEAATGSSVHSAERDLARGFVTARGGVRVGVCGTLGPGGAMRDVSSLAVRIPRQVLSAGTDETRALALGNASVLIISPPGGGKTTLLRELVRAASDAGVRVALADERGEVAAVVGGEPQFDVGRCTDVLTGAPKAEGAMLLLRAMGAQVIALDEVTAPGDVAAISSVAGCGVRVFATAHAGSVDELARRPLYREMLGLGVFKSAVVISRRGAERTYRVAEL